MRVQLFTDRITCFDKVIPLLLLSLFFEREKDTDVTKNNRILVSLLVVKYYITSIVDTQVY